MAMPAIALPTLTDGDLTLRPPRPGDADAVTAACQDPEIPRWTLVPSPYRRDHAEEFIARSAAAARAGDTATLLAFDPDGRLLGSFSAMEIDHGRGYGEIGYWVAAGARGRGVATRAVVLLRDWAHAELGLTLVEILPHRDNAPSRRVAEKAGFTPTGELRPQPRTEDPGEPCFDVLAWRPPGLPPS
jgi:RimJ/RimL family protein N-acetyltransferase